MEAFAENKAVIKLVADAFAKHWHHKTQAHYYEIVGASYRGEWGMVAYLPYAPAHFCDFNNSAAGLPIVMIDLPDQPHLIVSAVGAYTAPRIQGKEGAIIFPGYVAQYQEADALLVRGIIDTALKGLAQDIVRRTLTDVAEQLTRKGGFAALKKAIALKDELGA